MRARGSVGRHPQMIALSSSPTLEGTTDSLAAKSCVTVNEIVLTSRARHKTNTMFHLDPFPIEGNKPVVKRSRGRHWRQSVPVQSLYTCSKGTEEALTKHH